MIEINGKIEKKLEEELKIKEELAKAQQLPAYEPQKRKAKEVAEREPEIPAIKVEQTDKKVAIMIEEPPPPKEDILKEIRESNIEQDTKKSDELLKKGNKLFKEEKLDEAKLTFKESAQLNKNNYWAIAGISKVYIKNKEYDTAVDTINEAINIYKKNTKNFSNATNKRRNDY